MRILSLIVVLVIIFSAVRSEAMRVNIFRSNAADSFAGGSAMWLKVEPDNATDMIDIAEFAKHADLRKSKQFTAFGLPIPEMVIEEAITFAGKSNDLLSAFVLRHPYAPLVVMYWNTVMLYNHGQNQKYKTFKDFLESFTIKIMPRFNKFPEGSEGVGDLLFVRDYPKKITMNLLQVFEQMLVNQRDHPDYDVMDFKLFVEHAYPYSNPTDFSMYDIVYDILYNNIATILRAAYANNTIKKVLPIHQPWLAYKQKPDMWTTSYSGSSAENNKLLKFPYNVEILYPRALPGTDIREIFVAKARQEQSSGFGIGYDELYEFLVNNLPKRLEYIDYQAMWPGSKFTSKDFITNNVFMDTEYVLYEKRFYSFDGDRERGNGDTSDDSLMNLSRFSLSFNMYYRYAALQCLSMLFFYAYAVNGGK